MKFDVVIGNPPYQSGSGNHGQGQSLWEDFAIKSFGLTKDSGYMCLIHPPKWRNPNAKGKPKQVYDMLSNSHIIYLSINSLETGIKTFSAATPFDCYIVKKANTNNLTKIKWANNQTETTNIRKYNIIPNNPNTKLNKVIDTNNTVNVLYSRSEYGTDKPHMSKTKTSKHIWPCVKYSSITKTEPDLYYSSRKGSMIGKTKVLFGIGANQGKVIIDYKGEWGLCQWVAAIETETEYAEYIKQALESTEFNELMNSVRFTTQQFNLGIIKQLKKNFWEYFV